MPATSITVIKWALGIVDKILLVVHAKWNFTIGVHLRSAGGLKNMEVEDIQISMHTEFSRCSQSTFVPNINTKSRPQPLREYFIIKVSYMGRGECTIIEKK